MINSISSVATSGNYGLSATAAASSVARTTDSGLAQAAANLAATGGIVATLGGGFSSPLTYDAAGLLNSLVQAGTAPSSAQAAGNNSATQAIVSALPADPAASGIYNASGSLQGLPSSTSASWANILKTNSIFASAVISDSFNQGIVGTLSTLA